MRAARELMEKRKKFRQNKVGIGISNAALVLVSDIKSPDSFRSACLLITVKMDNVKVC